MNKLSLFWFAHELAKELLFNWDHMIDWITKMLDSYSVNINDRTRLFIAHLYFNRWYQVTVIEELIEKMKKRLEVDHYADWNEIDFYFYTKIKNKKIEIWVEMN